jgi:hypothetical protein
MFIHKSERISTIKLLLFGIAIDALTFFALIPFIQGIIGHSLDNVQIFVVLESMGVGFAVGGIAFARKPKK